MYARHGDPHKLAGFCGAIGALTAVIRRNCGALRWISAKNTIMVFLERGPLLLVAVSRTEVQSLQINCGNQISEYSKTLN
jgi:hypothetical protein